VAASAAASGNDLPFGALEAESGKEIPMSLLSIGHSAAAALPAVNFHPHNHRRTSNAGSGSDDTSNSAAQVPVATVQNLFGHLLDSLEQVIGLQTGVGAAAPAAATAAPPVSPSTGAAASVERPNSVQSANTLLQNYLRNLPQGGAKYGAPMAGIAVTSTDTTA
jgi:hypothetical protein